MPGTDLSPVASALCADLGFVLVDRVGVGGFKQTFHVRLSDGNERALKVFQEANNPERTGREIDAMSRCEHANIGVLSKVGTFLYQGRDYLFCLEEYLSGGTLSRKIEARLLTPDETYGLGERLISAVAHIASHRLVHRDLKPDNIMFRADGVTPVVVDFGIVRDLEGTSITKSWAIRGPGTAYYAAPEQLNNDKDLIDWRTDQFALGVLLAKSTFGVHPFEEPGDDRAQTIERVAQRARPPAHFRTAATGANLAALIQMVAPWPVERYRTPDQLIGAWRAQR